MISSRFCCLSLSGSGWLYRWASCACNQTDLKNRRSGNEGPRPVEETKIVGRASFHFTHDHIRLGIRFDRYSAGNTSLLITSPFIGCNAGHMNVEFQADMTSDGHSHYGTRGYPDEYKPFVLLKPPPMDKFLFSEYMWLIPLRQRRR